MSQSNKRKFTPHKYARSFFFLVSNIISMSSSLPICNFKAMLHRICSLQDYLPSCWHVSTRPNSYVRFDWLVIFRVRNAKRVLIFQPDPKNNRLSSDFVCVNKLTLILKNSVQTDITEKNLTSVLKVSTDIITSVTAHPIRLTEILAIKSVSTFKTDLILY